MRLLIERYEKKFFAAIFVVGFLFDIFTLPPSDRISAHLVILGYIVVIIAGIAVCRLWTESWIIRFADGAAHFSFGGLWSALFVFYFRAATLAGSWVFLLFLGAVFAGTDYWRDRYRSFIVQLIALYGTLFLFLLYYIPLLSGHMGILSFLLSGAIAAVIVLGLATTLSRPKEERRRAVIATGGIVSGIFLLLSGLFISGMIPPIPLALAHIGVYHDVQKITNNPPTYRAVSEGTGRWYDRLLNITRTYHRSPGEGASVVSTIVVPAHIATTIYHEWKFYDTDQRTWITTLRLPLSITSGRLEGFRTWSRKDILRDGLWRVDAITEEGAIIGRTEFRVETTEIPVSETTTYL